MPVVLIKWLHDQWGRWRGRGRKGGGKEKKSRRMTSRFEPVETVERRVEWWSKRKRKRKR